jgi:hypothetical protein
MAPASGDGLDCTSTTALWRIGQSHQRSKMESKIDVKGNSATETLQMERISIDCVTYLLSNSE